MCCSAGSTARFLIVKLDEIEGVPLGDAPHRLTPDQGQALVQSLVGGPPGTIAITADPDGTEAVDYALAIATGLGIAGWQIAGSQICRTVPPDLDHSRLVPKGLWRTSFVPARL